MKKYEVIGVKDRKPAHFAGFFDTEEDARKMIDKHQHSDPVEHLMLATLDFNQVPDLSPIPLSEEEKALMLKD